MTNDQWQRTCKNANQSGQYEKNNKQSKIKYQKYLNYAKSCCSAFIQLCVIKRSNKLSTPVKHFTQFAEQRRISPNAPTAAMSNYYGMIE